MYCASVRYDCTFAALTGQGGAATFSVPNAVEIGFIFQTGSSQPDPARDLTAWTWDYSRFDQDTVEAGITQYLNAICGQIAGLMGVGQAQVQATVAVRRVWNFGAIQTGSAAPQQIGPDTGTAVTETMAYP
jgi:hypothetical protein